MPISTAASADIPTSADNNNINANIYISVYYRH